MKSALSLSTALSLLGAKQVYGVIAAGSGEDVFAPVTQIATAQLDESMRNLHHSAESLESRVVDMAILFMNPGRWLNPGTWNAWKAAANPNHGAPGSAEASTDREASGRACCDDDEEAGSRPDRFSGTT